MSGQSGNLGAVHGHLNVAQQQMHEGIQRALDRGTQMEQIGSRTESLRGTAAQFNAEATRYRRDVELKQKAAMIGATLGFIVLVLILLEPDHWLGILLGAGVTLGSAVGGYRWYRARTDASEPDQSDSLLEGGAGTVE